MNTKYTDGLMDVLEQKPERVEVIIELEPGADVNTYGLSRGEAMEQSKSAFQEAARPVQEIIESEGGDVLGSAWLNKTIKAKVNTDCLDHLASLSTVSAIDVPHRVGRSVY